MGKVICGVGGFLLPSIALMLAAWVVGEPFPDDGEHWWRFGIYVGSLVVGGIGLTAGWDYDDRAAKQAAEREQIAVREDKRMAEALTELAGAVKELQQGRKKR